VTLGLRLSTKTDPLLHVQSLMSRYGGPFNLSVAQGECIAVMGRSGSGKSVLLRLIADMDPHDGDVMLNGRSRNAAPAPQWRRQVIYQAAEPAWWAPTVAAHLRSRELSTLEPLLLQLALDPAMLDADITRLSTGERQRMALVRSLTAEPKVLLLDEPTASLDQASTLAVEDLLRTRIARGLSVIWVTHSSEQASRVAQRIFQVRDGELHLLSGMSTS
jgi:ABC-type iron transport system FetAB ATPase subunit